MGPPGAFATLPASEVTRLQEILLDQRLDFLRDPASATPQSIAGFASLHISMSFTAALAAQLLGAGRSLKIGLWIWFAVTLANTIYLGWHYVLDDIGGAGAVDEALLEGAHEIGRQVTDEADRIGDNDLEIARKT